MATSTSAMQGKLAKTSSFNNLPTGRGEPAGHGSNKTPLSQAIQDVLSHSENQHDNQQQLAQIHNLIEHLDKDQLNKLIDSMPDTSLSTWIQEIRKTNHSNSGLSADQRRDFFNLLAQNLSVDQLQRWETLLPTELVGELDDARQQNQQLLVNTKSQVANLDLYSDINQFALKTGSLTNGGLRSADFAGDLTQRKAVLSESDFTEFGNFASTVNTAGVLGDESVVGTADVNQPAIEINSTQSLDAEIPTSEEFARVLEDIAVTMPEADASVHTELAQSYVKLQETLKAYRAGDTSAPLLEQIKETNALFKSIGNGAMLPTTRGGAIIFSYGSDNVPRELLSMAQRSSGKDREYGDVHWSMNVSIDRMPVSLLLKQGDRLLETVDASATQVRSDQFDLVRGFEFDKNTESALVYLESRLFGVDPIYQQQLPGAIVNLGIHHGRAVGQADTQIVGGEYQVSTRLLSDAGIEIFSEPQSETVWVNLDQLTADELGDVANTLRNETLEANLDERGTEKFDELQRAIVALDTTRSPEENKQLALLSLKLERSIALSSSSMPSGLQSTLEETVTAYRAAGIPTTVSNYSNGSLFIQYNSSTIPQDIRYRYQNQKTMDDREFGDSRWFVRIPLSQLSDKHLLTFAKSQLDQPAYHAAVSNLSQMDQFEDHLVSHNSDFQLLMDQAAPVDAAMLPADTIPLAELLRNYDSASASASSKNDRDYENLALISYDIASSLLSDNPENLSSDQLKELHTWVNGSDLKSLGYETRYEERDHNDETITKFYGVGGNFGEPKRRFAEAWLGSSREERIAYLGINEQSWNQAEMYIGAGLQSERVARDIRRAEFGLDDVVKIGIALAIGYASGGAASGFVSTALGGTAVSAATAGFLASAAGGAVGGFSSTLILTDGDIDAALKSGVMGAITGGLGEYASTLSGSNKVIAEAIISGVASEVSGREFLDGVLASVGATLGADVALKLKDRMPEFIANFSGKVVEIAVRVKGDPDLIQAELEQYVIDYASGTVRTSLTRSMGPEYRHVAASLGDLAGVVIANGGDMSKVRDYLNSDEFYTSFGNNIGNQVIDNFGGKENFTAVLSGRITNLVIASRGDMQLVEKGMEGLALSVVGDWAGRKMTGLMNSNLSGDERPIADAMGGLINVAISSGWNENAVSAYMNGPLIAALGEEGAAAIPERFGSPEGFVADALVHLTASYSANNGDMDKVAEDMTHFIFGRMIEFDKNQAASAPLTIGASGERVTELQDKLLEYGYLESSSSGVFDQETLIALTNFQNAQIDFIDAQLDKETNITLRGYINEQLNMLGLERDNSEFGVVTAELIRQPYVTKTIINADPIDNVVPDGWQNASIDGLSHGDTGAGVYRLQHRLQDLGYEPGALDSEFGDATLSALQAFQQDQKSLLESMIGGVINQRGTQQFLALASLGSGIAIDLFDGTTSKHTAHLLANPVTNGTLAPALLEEFGRPSGEELVDFIHQAIHADSPSGFIKVNGSELSDINFEEMMDMVVSELVDTGIDEDWYTGDPLTDAVLAGIEGVEYGSTGPTLEARGREMLRTGHAGVGHRLSYEEAIWLWENGNGTPIIVDGRALTPMVAGGGTFASPGPMLTTLDDLRVHGHISLDGGGEIRDGMYDFEPRWMSNNSLNPLAAARVTARNILNQAAIMQNGEGTPYEIQYQYDDSDFSND